MPDKDLYDERELLRRLAAGEDQAFSQIYQRYSGMIFSAAMLYLKDIHSAQDIVQQVFVKIWEKKTLMGNVNNFQDYIIVTSRNLIYDQFRRKNTEAQKLAELAERKGSSAVNNSSILAEEHEYARLLQSAIDQLPPQQKKIYLLVHEEGLPYEKAASQLGLSKLTVKKHLELARRFVRDYVTRHLH